MSHSAHSAHSDCLLVKAVKRVTDLAGLVLTDKHVQNELKEAESGRSKMEQFWGAFLQVVLSSMFGTHTLKLDNGVGCDPSPLWKAKEHYLPLLEYAGAYEEWCRINEGPVRWLIANFWNADDTRIPAAVVNLLDGNGEEAEPGWLKAWELMKGINDLPYNSGWPQSPHSIGTFVVARSRQLGHVTNAFEMRLGPREHHKNFLDFAKWAANQSEAAQLLNTLTDRQARVRCLLSLFPAWHAQMEGPLAPEDVSRKLDGAFTYLEVPVDVWEQLLKRLEGLKSCPAEKRPALVKDLARVEGVDPPDWSELAPYLDYLACFLLWRFYHDPCRASYPPQDQIDWKACLPSELEMRLLLLNNLLLDDAMKGGDDSTLRCHYCLPTWNKSASYLYLVLEKPLEQVSLICFQNLTSALFSIAWNHDSLRKEAEHRHAVIDNGERAARAAIMARNLSHNMGSHVIASINANANYVGAERDLDAVFAFLQVRMDFIARITTDWPVWGQPTYFVKDIMLPWLTRFYYVVRNLVGMQWSRPIEFVIHVHGESITLPLERDLVSKEIPIDCAIMIPEGPCGAHAVYVLLENLLRNSVKYGVKAGKKCLRVHLALLDGDDGCLRLRIWDNFGENRPLDSLTGDSKPRFLVDLMEKKYRSSLIDDVTGVLKDVDWGIQEMVTSARFLLHPEARPYPECVKVGTVDAEGNAAPRDEPSSFLYTEILLKRPRHLALVSRPSAAAPDAAGVEFLNDIEELARSQAGCPMALIDMSDPVRWPGQIQEIAQLHQCLPYRLLAFTSEESVRALRETFEKWRGPGHEAKPVPVRRVHVVSEESIRRPGPSAKTEDWEVYLLTLRTVWLSLRYPVAPEAGKRMLVISFQRRADVSIFHRWQEQLAKTNPHDKATNEFLDVVLLSTGSADVEVRANRGDVPKFPIEWLKTRPARTTVVYDNHDDLLLKSKMTTGPRMSTGISNAKTFGQLVHPPADAFAFNDYLLSLYEAGLASVVVIDERVSHAALEVPSRHEENPLDYRKNSRIQHDVLNAANCYPQHSARKETRNGTAIVPLCDAHADTNRDTTVTESPIGAEDRVDRNQLPIPQDEGIDLDDPKKGHLWCRHYHFADKALGFQGATFPVESVEPDFVMIHQGLIDTLFRGVPQAAIEKWIGRLYQIAPTVIITSGRGVVRKARGMPFVPFVEFSVLKGALYPELCKPDLLATLAFVKGVSAKEAST